MENVVVLEWKYEPADFFEDDFELTCFDYTLSVSRGKVEARIDSELYKNHEIRSMLHVELNKQFLAEQVVSHRRYTLYDSSMCQLFPDGHEEHTVFADSITMHIRMTSPDVVLKDCNGNVIKDTKKERLEKQKHFSDLIEKHYGKDKLHLYEIRDALSTRFGGQRAACSKLGIYEQQWKRFGELANHAPLRQGRHRGENLGQMRDATGEELQEARDIALLFVTSYLEFLSKDCQSRTDL